MKKEIKYIGKQKQHKIEVLWEQDKNFCSGVYMLIFSCNMIYIGKSKNIHNRIMGSDGHFDKLSEDKAIYDSAMKSDKVIVRILKETTNSIDNSFYERVFIHEQAIRILKKLYGNEFKPKGKISKYKRVINSCLLNQDLLNW